MIRLEHLSKTFRGRPALSDLTLEIPRGAMFGLLGHNGAGKSTTFGLLLGHIRATTGTASINGFDVRTHRAEALRKVGAVFEAPAFYDYLSGWENLRILASYSGSAPDEELHAAVQRVRLTARIHDPVQVYSHGMRQRLALAQALVPRPDVLLLDEPTDGLDPAGIHEIREVILDLNRREGMTVLLSSHLLSEVEAMCDEIAILHQGRLSYTGRWADLERSGPRFRLAVSDWPAAETLVARMGGRVVAENTIELPPDRDVAELVAALVAAGQKVRAVEPLRRTLEQLYLETIGSETA